MHTSSNDSLESYAIEQLPVTLVGGPDHGVHADVTTIHLLGGRRVVRSRHSEGFYWLPPCCHRDPETGSLLAEWQPHPDARFPWRREIRGV